MLTDKERAAVAVAVQAFQRVAMAHPSSDDHSQDMYLMAETGRSALLPLLKEEK